MLLTTFRTNTNVVVSLSQNNAINLIINFQCLVHTVTKVSTEIIKHTRREHEQIQSKWGRMDQGQPTTLGNSSSRP